MRRIRNDVDVDVDVHVDVVLVVVVVVVIVVVVVVAESEMSRMSRTGNECSLGTCWAIILRLKTSDKHGYSKVDADGDVD